MVNAVVLASLVETPLVDPSAAAIVPSKVTSGTDAHIQIDILGTKARDQADALGIDSQTDGSIL